MSKKIIAVNAGPRKGWNTDTLISEAVKGAEAAGAETERFDMYRLEKYTGCISCFGCKRERYKGHCICRDGLTPVLDAIRESDGLIIGSPNYLSEMTSAFRALYERLIFQNLTYNLEEPCCNAHPVPVLLIMTSNAPDTRKPSKKGTRQYFRKNAGRLLKWAQCLQNKYSTDKAFYKDGNMIFCRRNNEIEK